MSAQEPVLTWLLAGDPAVVWQVERDLIGLKADVYEATRDRIPVEGWGKALLDKRADDGRWANGLYGPKWTSTFYTLRLLYWFGLDGTWPSAVESCALLLDEGVEPDGGVRLWSGPNPDVCVTAMLLAMAVHFGHCFDDRCDAMARWLLREQLDDGGFNCSAQTTGSRKGSFHTTLSALEALHAYATRPQLPGTGVVTDAAVDEAQVRGQEYFLRHRLFRSERTGQVVKESFTRFSFPPRWYFDVLRALDHFRAAGAARDVRLDDALALLKERQGADGLWKNQNHHTGLEYFVVERAGQPSRWNTLRARRVLDWFER